MDNKAVVSKLVADIVDKSKQGKLLWQLNSTKDGFVTFVDDLSIEIRQPDKTALTIVHDITTIKNTVMYEPRPYEYRILISNLKSGAFILELGESFFSKEDHTKYKLPTSIFEHIFFYAKEQLENSRARDASQIIEKLNKL